MSGFVEVREPHTDKLLFRFDPARLLVEIQRRGVKTVVDLEQYRAPKGAPEDERRTGTCGTWNSTLERND